MRDPLEGLTSTGTIRTGADRNRIPGSFVAVLDAVVEMASAHGPDVSVYAYGSVATGRAQRGSSDVDVLTIDLPAMAAEDIGSVLSDRSSEVCRSVEIAAGATSGFEGDSDEAYGGRVFLHHYCVHLAGPDRDLATAGFPGDARAARGFNGDIAHHARRWRQDVGTRSPDQLGRSIARKALFAVAGLVSIHDSTWTTDRDHAARRWSAVDPDLAGDLTRLREWTEPGSSPSNQQIAEILDSIIDPIVTRFDEDIGLWDD